VIASLQTLAAKELGHVGHSWWLPLLAVRPLTWRRVRVLFTIPVSGMRSSKLTLASFDLALGPLELSILSAAQWRRVAGEKVVGNAAKATA
jgi:hypothetical protein